ncbi:MAG: acetate/propionate family kinase, partial [Candidatus Saccharibacteria bacterium]
MAESLILVVNPGSASRKYALFEGGLKKATVHFEFVNNKVVGTVSYNDLKQSVEYDDPDLSNVARYVLSLLHQYEVISKEDNLSAIGIRVVAPSDSFAEDKSLNDEVIAELESLQQKAPLHITTALSEIKHLKTYFVGIPLVAVSDSSFHNTKPIWAQHYGIDTNLAKTGIKRYGYHGVSISSVAKRLQESNNLANKVIVCHIGSGSSITALVDGKSVETTMGYSPLEGLMMSTRSGSIDLAAALAIKRELQLDDNGLEQYLNKKSGLIGVSGSSDDIRQLLASEEGGDIRAKLALQLFIYKIQQAIGQMAASMNGVDALVFTATIGERSFIIRERILSQLSYLGFEVDKNVNDNTFEPKEITNIAQSASKPVLVVGTDESAEIARRVIDFIN